MNRIEYMRRLAALLQDVPVEERVEAMQYYNDYFDDAGEENEDKVIAELGSPEKVAAEMKAGLGRGNSNTGEFRETGYTDTQFEEKEMPARYNTSGQQNNGKQQNTDRRYAGYDGRQNDRRQYGGYDGQENPGGQPQQGKPWTSNWLKLLLIILIICVGAPVVLPLAIGLLAVVFGLFVAAFALFIALAALAVALAVAGAALFIKGCFLIISSLPAALALMGSGLILAVLGVIATVAAVRLCMIVLPGIFRFFVELCRKPFRKREAVA